LTLTRAVSAFLESCKRSAVLRQRYRRSPVLRWLHGLTTRRHWRQIHTRHSCVYGTSLRPFVLHLLGALAGVRRCDGATVARLESRLAATIGVGHVVTFASGRNSFRAILQALGIGRADEVIVPAFTCVVVPYTVLHCGATPVYVDIQRDYRMSLEALRTAITPRTKAIVAQHTFGLPDRMVEILALARARGIRVIEDCAHVLPGSTDSGKALGTWGDAAYFSFETGKTVSAGWGGAAVTSDEGIGERLRRIKDAVEPLGRRDNVRIGSRLLPHILLLHPNLFALGGLVRARLNRRGFLPQAMPPAECRGEPPTPLLGRVADIQATLLLSQLERLSAITDQRRSCVTALARHLGGCPVDLPLMWYPLQVRNRDDAVKQFSRHQLELRTWETPLTPADCDTTRAGYTWGSCPVAEEVSRGCVALPTMLSRADLDRVKRVASRYLDVDHRI
jgi:dTDP-4-amino-4,6-dideoxygalactose transaminase